MFSAELSIYDTRRRSPRTPVAIETTLDGGDLSKFLCRVTDLSPEGARISTYSAMPAFGAIILTLPLLGARVARIIWSSELEAGCAFEEPLTDSETARLKARFATKKF